MVTSFCIFHLAAQNIRIEGTVLDAVTGIPVAGATAVLRYSTSPAPIDKVVTGAPGTFELSVTKPGSYAVELSADGFAETVFTDTSEPLRFSNAQFENGAGDTIRKIVVRIQRSGGLRGTIRDAETREPVQYATVWARRSFWLRGRRRLKEEGIAFSNDSGEFRLESLPAGEYVIEVQYHVDAQSSSGDTSKKQYPTIFWPGADPANIAWIKVEGGVDADVGTIDYTRVKPARVRGVITAKCHPESGNHLSLLQQIGGAFINRDPFIAACDGKPFPIPAVWPGAYKLIALSPGFQFGPDMETTPTSIGAVDFLVKEGESRDVEVKMSEGSRITGKVICDCQTPFVAGPDRTGVGLNPADGIGLAEAFDFNHDGLFEGRAALSGPVNVEFLNLSQDLYIKQIVFNGAESGRMVTILSGGAETLEITLSDSPSSITGTVTRESKPVPRDHVVAVPWPLRLSDGYPDFVSTESGAAGEFSLTKLAPGKYKVVSVGPAEWSRKDEPGVVELWLTGVDETELADRVTLTMRLESKLQ